MKNRTQLRTSPFLIKYTYELPVPFKVRLIGKQSFITIIVVVIIIIIIISLSFFFAPEGAQGHDSRRIRKDAFQFKDINNILPTNNRLYIKLPTVALQIKMHPFKMAAKMARKHLFLKNQTASKLFISSCNSLSFYNIEKC